VGKFESRFSKIKRKIFALLIKVNSCSIISLLSGVYEENISKLLVVAVQTVEKLD
jgi:hypothetical protein